MSKVRVVFLGTPEFAVTSLKALFEDEHFQIVGVVTQPDRPAGRKMNLQPSPVKAYAQSVGLHVFSPESVNTSESLAEIGTYGAEVAVVVAFGQLLKDDFLKLFPLGAVNVHGSLLPRWRGAAPIQRAIEFGDSETGVCLQKIVRKLDAGDVLGVRRVQIDEHTDARFLFESMARGGADLLKVELMDYVRGHLVGSPQDENLVTYAKKIDKSEGLLDWSMSASSLSCKIRAFDVGPGTWSYLREKKIKIHKVKLIENSISQSAKTGEILKIQDNEMWVQTGNGILCLLELQPESRNRCSIKEFINSFNPKVGEQWGAPSNEQTEE